MGNGMVCHKKRHPLLHECFITFLRCIKMMGWASDSIDEPTIVYIKPILPRLTLKLYTTDQICWARSQHRKWDGVLQWVISITAGVYQYPPPMYIGKWDELLTAFTSTLLFTSWYFCVKLTLKLYPKYHMMGTLSVWEMRWCAVRTRIHCCWSIANPSWHVWGSWDELLISSICLMWFTLCDFH